MAESIQKTDYEQIYTATYYSGENSFFYKIFGGYKDIRPYFNRLARWFDSYVQGPNILDIGCAYGYLLNRFNGRGQLFGVDVSEYAIAVAQQNYPDYKFQTAILGVKPLPFADGFLQTVIATDVMEHLHYKDQPAAAKDILRVLAPGGKFLMTTPNRSLIRRIFYRIPDRMEHHFGMRDQRDWINFFVSQGFELVRTWTYLHGMLPFRWRFGILPELAVVLQKPEAK